MPHEGYANPITNDEPKFHSDMPVSELTKAHHSSHRGKWRQLNPSGCGKHGWGDNHKDELTPRPDPYNARGLKGSWTRKETEYAVTE